MQFGIANGDPFPVSLIHFPSVRLIVAGFICLKNASLENSNSYGRIAESRKDWNLLHGNTDYQDIGRYNVPHEFMSI
jgi:hypothetical protein